MGHHVIVGAGTIGSALAVRLAAAGQDVTVVSRRGSRPGVAGDRRRWRSTLRTRRRCSGVAEGADVLYNCANPTSYRALGARLAADRRVGARRRRRRAARCSSRSPTSTATARSTTRICEGDALAATSAKGRVRAAMWREALAAHEAGSVRATEVRASDFFGPGITSTGVIGSIASCRGSSITRRSRCSATSTRRTRGATSTTSRARSRSSAGDERAWGRAWHAPTAAPRSAREAVAALADAAGLDAPSVRRVPWAVVRAAGCSSARAARPARDRLPVRRAVRRGLEDFTATFGREPTAFEDACVATVGWWRRRRGFPLPSLADASSSR